MYLFIFILFNSKEVHGAHMVQFQIISTDAQIELEPLIDDDPRLTIDAENELNPFEDNNMYTIYPDTFTLAQAEQEINDLDELEASI